MNFFEVLTFFEGFFFFKKSTILKNLFYVPQGPGLYKNKKTFF